MEDGVKLEQELRQTGQIITEHTHNINKILSEFHKRESEQASNCARNTATSSESVAHNHNMFARLNTPVFDGQITSYPDFKRRFKDLTRLSGLPVGILLEHLANAVPQQQRHMVDGSETLPEAWDRLDEKFGDRRLSIITVQRNLMAVDLSKVKEYEKVEKLYDEINRALRLLKQLGSDDNIVKDLQIVSRLVEKLPENLQVDWSRHATKSSEPLLPGLTEWNKFMEWLNQERKAALLRRDYQEARKNDQPSNTSSTKPYCSHYRSLGHRTTDCKVKRDGINCLQEENEDIQEEKVINESTLCDYLSKESVL